MDEFVAWLWNVSYWHWWALAGILIALEILVASTYLLWPAVAAAAMGAIVFFAPEFDWRVQVLTFAVMSFASVIALHTWRRRHAPEPTDHPNLNSRGQGYVGRRFRVAENFIDGTGRLRVDDTWWAATTDDGSTPEPNALVEVTAVEGNTLKVRVTTA